MSDRTQIERTLREAYAARQRGDVDKVLDLFAPDARFVMAGTASITPMAMRVEGATQLRSALEGMVKTFILLDLDIVNILVDGDRGRCTGARGSSPR
jgi:ketosteroid isomerase-like protein